MTQALIVACWISRRAWIRTGSLRMLAHPTSAFPATRDGWPPWPRLPCSWTWSSPRMNPLNCDVWRRCSRPVGFFRLKEVQLRAFCPSLLGAPLLAAGLSTMAMAAMGDVNAVSVGQAAHWTHPRGRCGGAAPAPLHAWKGAARPCRLGRGH